MRGRADQMNDVVDGQTDGVTVDDDGTMRNAKTGEVIKDENSNPERIKSLNDGYVGSGGQLESD